MVLMMSDGMGWYAMISMSLLWLTQLKAPSTLLAIIVDQVGSFPPVSLVGFLFVISDFCALVSVTISALIARNLGLDPMCLLEMAEVLFLLARFSL